MQTSISRALTLIVLSAASALCAANESSPTLDVKACKVEYPKTSLVNEEQGVVSMSFLVSPTGSVVDSKLEKTSGYKNLDRAALKGLAGCKFKPGTKDGAPVQTWARIDYNWSL